MSEQWIREFELTVGNQSSATRISGDDLRVRFDVRKASQGGPEQADILITNLSNATANKIQKEYDYVSLKAGYRGNSSTIFEGEIVQKRGPARENPTDTYFNILATASQKGYSYAVISKTLSKGHTFKDQIEACLEALKPYGISAGHVADLGSAKMPRGRALFGMVRHQLNQICAATGTTWRIDGSKLNVVKKNGSLPGSITVINSGTGMIGMPVQTMDGVEVKCLLNPNLKVDSLIKIDEASIQKAKYSLTWDNVYERDRSILDQHIAADGVYKVLWLSHSGDTRGNPWYTDIKCTAAANGGPITQNSAASYFPSTSSQGN